MLLFLLTNWKWLLPTAIGAMLGLLLGFSRIEVANLHASAAKTALAIETQKTTAANMLATETAKVAKLQGENEDLNAKLEKTRAESDIKTAAAAADLNDAMSRWMRSHPGCRASRAGAAGANQGAAQPSGDASGGDTTETLPAGSAGFIRSCARAADTLAAYVREAHEFTQHLTCTP